MSVAHDVRCIMDSIMQSIMSSVQPILNYAQVSVKKVTGHVNQKISNYVKLTEELSPSFRVQQLSSDIVEYCQ